MTRLNKPNLKVIDLAIKLIETNKHVYSCCALSSAIMQMQANIRCETVSLYTNQYTKYVTRKNHGYPTWWNEDNSWQPGYFRKTLYESNKAARIRALKGFKQACIDAAKNKVQ